MPNHFEDRRPGEVYDLNGAPVVLMRQRAAPWGQTWIVRYLRDTPDVAFSLEPGYLNLLSWELLGHVGHDGYVPVPRCALGYNVAACRAARIAGELSDSDCAAICTGCRS